MTQNGPIDVPDSSIFTKDPRNRAIIDKKRNKTKTRKFRKANEETVNSIIAKYKDLDQESACNFTRFSEFPLSKRTLKGLEEGAFTTPTDIQRQSLGLSVTGHDVVGAAKTGSGKTLALLIPLLECLWKNKWTRFDGLGALIITPTRELAYQIFNVLNKIGKHHEFSAALLIGGTDVEYEKKRLFTMNIIVCTPGRLLQHMDENDTFSCENLQMLVIDEADRILDMGFKSQINAIMENLPETRQTLLFSATQTKNVKDLVRVCLRDPVYVSVHENADKATPDQLIQSYFVCAEEDKLNMLWSFLVNHRRRKTLIFVTCCKQARFYTTALKHLKPGVPLMGIWGTMKQNKRLAVFEKFNTKEHGSAMIATDVASRGLDFNKVDYVLQLDCPADVDDYIHRVGRTARLDKRGEAILVLNPTQEGPFAEKLKAKKIPIKKTHVDPKKVQSIRNMLSSAMIKYSDMKDMAQRGFVSYIRALHLMKLKDVFDIKSIDFKELAFSYGLAVAPRVRFLNKYQKNQSQTKENRDAFAKEPQNIESFDTKELKSESKRPDLNNLDLSESEDELESGPEEAGDDEDFLKVARTDVFNVLTEPTPEEIKKHQEAPSKKPITKLEAAKKALKKGQKGTKVVFGNDGDEAPENPELKPTGFDLEDEKRRLSEQYAKDKREWRERLKKLKKQKSKKKNQDEEEVLDLGADDSDEGSIDLSWLPDPDSNAPEEPDDSENESEPKIPPKKGLKRKTSKDLNQKPRKKKIKH